MSARDSLGCSASNLHGSKELLGKNIAIYHKVYAATEINQVETPASDRGYLAGVSLGASHRREIQYEYHSCAYDFGAGSIYVRNFADPYRAELNPFDFLLLEVSQAQLQRASEEAGYGRISGLQCLPGTHDSVLHSLAQMLVAILDRNQPDDTLFIDQVAIAFQTYLVSNYAGFIRKDNSARRTLTRRQEAAAKEILRNSLDGKILISEVADACDLSRSYFIRAFRETTGLTPHQWLTVQRISRAKELLSQPGFTLAQVALACGFSDQSHFTRVFTKTAGRSPGTWRRDRSGTFSSAMLE